MAAGVATGRRRLLGHALGDTGDIAAAAVETGGIAGSLELAPAFAAFAFPAGPRAFANLDAFGLMGGLELWCARP